MNRWLALVPGALLAGAAAAETTVRVTGVQPDGGPVRIAVFDRAEGFPDPEAAVARSAVAASAAQVEAAMELPATPRLAVAAYQDLDGDGALGRNWLGIPTEPVGFSRGATIGFGPPAFDAAAVAVGEAPATVTITLDAGAEAGR